MLNDLLIFTENLLFSALILLSLMSSTFFMIVHFVKHIMQKIFQTFANNTLCLKMINSFYFCFSKFTNCFGMGLYFPLILQILQLQDVHVSICCTMFADCVVCFPHSVFSCSIIILNHNLSLTVTQNAIVSLNLTTGAFQDEMSSLSKSFTPTPLDFHEVIEHSTLFPAKTKNTNRQSKFVIYLIGD